MIETKDIAYVMGYTVDGDSYVTPNNMRIVIKTFDPINKQLDKMLFETRLDRKLITALKEKFHG